MTWPLSILLVSAIAVAASFVVGRKQKKPKRIMSEGKLLKSEIVCLDGEEFCDVTIRLEDCTYALNRQVEVIALVRSFRPIPVDEFDRIARPLIMSRNS